MKRISDKRLAKLGGKMPLSSIAPSAQPKKKSARRKRPIGRGPMPQRRSPVKKVNAKRQAKNFERAYGSKRAWIVAQPCAVCRYAAGPCDPAHAKGDGGSRKSSSAFLLPLCGIHPDASGALVQGCHRESHRGVQTFEAKQGVSLIELAADYERRWQASQHHTGD